MRPDRLKEALKDGLRLQEQGGSPMHSPGEMASRPRYILTLTQDMVFAIVDDERLGIKDRIDFTMHAHGPNARVTLVPVTYPRDHWDGWIGPPGEGIYIGQDVLEAWQETGTLQEIGKSSTVPFSKQQGSPDV